MRSTSGAPTRTTSRWPERPTSGAGSTCGWSSTTSSTSTPTSPSLRPSSPTCWPRPSASTSGRGSSTSSPPSTIPTRPPNGWPPWTCWATVDSSSVSAGARAPPRSAASASTTTRSPRRCSKKSCPRSSRCGKRAPTPDSTGSSGRPRPGTFSPSPSPSPIPRSGRPPATLPPTARWVGPAWEFSASTWPPSTSSCPSSRPTRRGSPKPNRSEASSTTTCPSPGC